MGTRRTVKAILRDRRAAQKRSEEFAEKAREEEERRDGLDEEYMTAIAEKLKSLLLPLGWEWPTSGRREVKAAIPETHAIVKLLLPVEATGFSLPGGIGGSCYRAPYWQKHDGYYVTMSTESAKALGLKNPGASRSEWASMRKKLKKAGITDEAKLAELLKKRGE